MEKLSAKEFQENYADITERINSAALRAGRNPEDIILLAATKTVDIDTINYAIEKGIKYIGENKVQELLLKDDSISGAHKHFIGHLQTNKVKDIINRVEMIESVDSLKLAAEISKQALKSGKTMNILIEINIGDEESKWGFTPENALDSIKEIVKLPNINVKGLMAIPPVCENMEENRKYFKQMYKLFIDISGEKIDNSSMEYLSMGMSDDFEIAIEEGANIIRLGTALFGKRIYK
jgi:pyridoxal phosphate enzyme (YggS family)